MAQLLRMLTNLPEEPDLIPSIHIVALNHLYLQFHGSQWPLLSSVDIWHHMVHGHKGRQNTQT